MNVYIYPLLILPATFAFSISSLWDSIVNGVSNYSFTNVYESLVISEDAHLSIGQLVNKYGYRFEEHQVVTDDGHILNIHRIPCGKDNAGGGMVIFLMHGILDSSDSWVLQGPDGAFGYMLADEGFDVWMGNARGNKHSLGHNTLNASVSEFWDFTWEEIGLYDLPATIDYVLNATGKDSLYYAGHSQGTTSFYVMSSMRPQYNERIRMMFSLAPESWMGHVRSPLLRMFSPASQILKPILSNLNTKVAGADFFNRISSVICSVLPTGCDNVLDTIMGAKNKVHGALLAVVLGHMPTGASTLQFLHYGQLVNSGRFCRYDFGREENVAKYGAEVPPDYDCSNIRPPVVVFYSGNDWFSDALDVETLMSCLPRVHEWVYLENYNHIDYVYSWDARDAVYSKVIDIIRHFEDTRQLEMNGAMNSDRI